MTGLYVIWMLEIIAMLIGGIYFLLWAIFSKPKYLFVEEPLLLRIAWIVIALITFYMPLDMLEKGNFVIPYKKEMDNIIMPLLLGWWVIFCIGSLQKLRHPKYPIYEKK